MFPFHRHHSSTAGTAHKNKNNANTKKCKFLGRSRDRGQRDEECDYNLQQQQSSSNYPQQATASYYPQPPGRASKTPVGHSELQQSRWDYVLGEANNVLRAKENVLLSSLNTAEDTDYAHVTAQRLGADTLATVLSSLHKLKVKDVPPASQSTTVDVLPASQSTTDDVLPATQSVTVNALLPVQSPTKIILPSGPSVASNVIVTPSATASETPLEPTEGSKTVILDCRIEKTESEFKTLVKSSSSDASCKPTIVAEQLLNESRPVSNLATEDDDAALPTRLFSKLWTHDPQPGANVVPKRGNLNEDASLGKDPTGESADVEEGVGREEDVVEECFEEDEGVEEDEDEEAMAEEENWMMDNRPGVTVINEQTATALKEVVVGSAKVGFNMQWLDQAFSFNTNQKLRYGFVQNKGGPCGVLATIQGFVLKTLLFEADACICTEPLRPTSVEARTALITAISDVLWRAASNTYPSLVVSTGDVVFSPSDAFTCDGLTETLSVVTFGCRATLQEGVQRYLNQYTTPGAPGCLLLILSAVLSRGILSVRADMDESAPLIASNGHCTLELVNLLLIGRAVSNVFDNNVKLDPECVLRGVHTRADVGFLSLFEHYNSCQVGTFLKTPRYPVWVVCSEGHFTVIFSCRRELVSDWRAEKRFTLFYYDTMARQQDEVKLTVDTTGLHLRTREEGYLIPPLEHCIRTKWKGAVVDWNGAYL